MGKKLDTITWTEKATAIHGDKYDYSRVVYENSKTPIEVICRTHGAFMIPPAEHINGTRRGCPECGRLNSISKRTSGKDAFVEKAKLVHGDKYDYSRVVYVNALSKVEIGHPDGFWFWQTPANHLSGHGSVEERNREFAEKYRLSTEEWVTRAKAVHGDRYDYSRVDYRGAHHKVEIGCSLHGWFEQIPQCHTDEQQGCPRCASSVRTGHRQVMEYLDTLGVTYEVNNRSVLDRKYELDIWFPDRKFAIEYCGLYHHSDRNGRHKDYHTNKHDACEKLGIRLITLFEDEWFTKQDLVKSVLRHLVGQSAPGCFARKVTVREIDWKSASEFLDVHHLLGAGSPKPMRIGAFNGDELIAVMLFGSPSDERGSSDEIEMNRFATDGRNHPGLASKMFKWAIRSYGFTRVIAFVDRRWYTGTFKTLSGFVQESVSPPSFFWTDCRSRFHRRMFSRDRVMELTEFQEGESKVEAMRRLGYYRIWDCGKAKLVWTS